MNINIGDKLYKTDGDKVTILRVLRIKHDKIIVLDEDNNKLSIDNKDISDYMKLKPDAHVTFSIVRLQDNIKDVIVSVHRRKDIEEGIELPYAVCRQNIIDLFANILEEDLYYIGCSVNKDTCPEGVDYKMMLACNSIHKMYMISAYIDDTLDTLLSLIPVRKFDEVLYNLYGSIGNVNLNGYAKTLNELLTMNCFMYDFHRGFNIDEVPFEISYDSNTLELDTKQRIYLEDLYKTEMFKTYIIPYTKEIDIDKIQRNYIMVNDSSNHLFIIAYDKGEYINRQYKQQIKDKRDAIALLKYKNNGIK